MRRFEKILHGGLYRSRNGIILGVCRGVAEYFDFSVFWARTIVFILFLFSGFWPIAVLYFIAALLMKPEPVIPIQTEDQQEFYDSYVYSRKGAIFKRMKMFLTDFLRSMMSRKKGFLLSRRNTAVS